MYDLYGDKMTNKDVINYLCYDYESKYLYFELADKQNPSTWIVNVFADDGDILLGQVRYYAHWRQYAFYPNEGTVYEKTCLYDITEFVKIINEQQKKGIKPENPQKTLKILDSGLANNPSKINIK